MRRFRPYFRYLRPHRGLLALGIVCGVLSGVATGAGLPLMTSTVFPVIFSPSGPRLTHWQLFLIALWLEKRKLRPGVLSAIMLVIYSLFRFGIDFLRYYENTTNLWGNQIVALCLTAVGVTLLILFLRWPFKPAQANAGARR